MVVTSQEEFNSIYLPSLMRSISVIGRIIHGNDSISPVEKADALDVWLTFGFWAFSAYAGAKEDPAANRLVREYSEIVIGHYFWFSAMSGLALEILEAPTVCPGATLPVLSCSPLMGDETLRDRLKLDADSAVAKNARMRTVKNVEHLREVTMKLYSMLVVGFPPLPPITRIGLQRLNDRLSADARLRATWSSVGLTADHLSRCQPMLTTVAKMEDGIDFATNRRIDNADNRYGYHIWWDCELAVEGGVRDSCEKLTLEQEMMACGRVSPSSCRPRP